MSSEKTIVNLAIVGGLAVGAYVLFNMMRQGAPATAAAAAAPPASRAQQNAQGLAGVINAATSLYRNITGTGSAPLLGTVDGRSAAQWDVTPFGNGGAAFNNPSAFVSSSVDGVAFNPPSASPYDYYYADGA